MPKEDGGKKMWKTRKKLWPRGATTNTLPAHAQETLIQ